MTTKYFEIKDEASWLEKRKGYITSTQISALFGLSNYHTAFELYHISRGNIEVEIEDNNFMKFGRIIEAPICEMINIEHPEWKIEEFPFFAYDDEDKIGSSFDRAMYVEGKKYLLEIKSISYAQYKEKFTEHSEDDIEASPAYELQMHTEMELTKDSGFDGVVMAVFILDTRQLRYIFRSYDSEIGEELRASAREFWALEEQPEPDYTRDKQVISRVCPQVNPNYEMDATEDVKISEIAARYEASAALEKQEKEAKEAAYAELMNLIGDARYVWTKDHKISASDIKENQGKLITEDMVGTRTGARKGFKRLTIKPQKKD